MEIQEPLVAKIHAFLLNDGTYIIDIRSIIKPLIAVVESITKALTFEAYLTIEISVMVITVARQIELLVSVVPPEVLLMLV